MATPTKARQTIIAKMARYGFTPAMCKDKSTNQLLYIAAITVQHRTYQGMLEPDELVQLREMEKITAGIRQVN